MTWPWRPWSRMAWSAWRACSSRPVPACRARRRAAATRAASSAASTSWPMASVKDRLAMTMYASACALSPISRITCAFGAAGRNSSRSPTASPRVVTGATTRTGVPVPVSSTLGRRLRITSSYRVPRSEIRWAGSPVSTLPVLPSRTTELPVKSVIRNDIDAARRCSLSIRATSSDSTGGAASAAFNVPAESSPCPGGSFLLDDAQDSAPGRVTSHHGTRGCAPARLTGFRVPLRGPVMWLPGGRPCAVRGEGGDSQGVEDLVEAEPAR